MTRLQTFALAATLASTLLCGSIGQAQDPKQDDALDKLLKKLDDAKPEGAPAKEAADEAKAKPGELETKDKALDSLLEKLGETKDTPAPDDRSRGGPGGPENPPPRQPGQTKADELPGEQKDLDRHLEELTGRKRKRDNRPEPNENSPLSKVIKEMRDVEERLGKPDTGEETRKKQAEIVKNLESLIQELQKSSSQSQGKRKVMLSMKKGSQPASKPGENPGAMAKGVGPQKPEKPTTKHSLAGGKDEWGHLPDALRQEMDNVFRETGLPKRLELIRRYYLSLSKKMVVREE